MRIIHYYSKLFTGVLNGDSNSEVELSEAQGALAAVETEVEVHATQREHLGRALDAKLRRSEARAAELQTSHFASEEALERCPALFFVGTGGKCIFKKCIFEKCIFLKCIF